MKNVQPILKSLGLLESEISVYLAALYKGSGTAAELANRSKLSRQAVYSAIESLIERGIMSSSLQGKKRFYNAESPKKLLAYAARHQEEIGRRIHELETLVPELELQVGGDRPVVRMFEGKEGLKAIMEDKKETTFDNIMEITDLDALYKILTPEDLQPMRESLKKRKIHADGIYTGVPGQKILQGERNILTSEFEGFKSHIGVYGNKIEMVTFEGKMYSVIIESKRLVQALRTLFTLARQGLNKQK